MREGSEDENDYGWDDDDGYHSDKYDDVEELPFKLDRGNLRKVTGLKNLPGNNDLFLSDESEDDKKDKGEEMTKTVQGRSEIMRRRRRTKKVLRRGDSRDIRVRQ